jgi:hypothetical protein
MTSTAAPRDANSTQPLAATLDAKLAEFDVATAGLAGPEPGSKIVKTGDLYSFQAPGYTQSIYRWWVGESQETTKEYIAELSERMVSLMDEAETMLGRFGRRQRQHQAVRIVHRGLPSAECGLREILLYESRAADVAEVAEALSRVDALVARLQAATAHVRELYAPAASRSEPAPESATVSVEAGTGDVIPPRPEPSVFDTWDARVSAAHAALCVASASFRG